MQAGVQAGSAAARAGPREGECCLHQILLLEEMSYS